MIFACLASAALAASGGALVPNGDFEQGRDGAPLHWQRPDGLTSSWVTAPGGTGKCIKLDSDVLQSEYLRRREEMAQEDPPPARPKSPTRPPYYDTVAGGEGVAYASDFIPIDPEETYVLSVRFRGEGKRKPKVFVKGYFEDPRRPEAYRRRVCYEKYMDCPGDATWRTFTMRFQPRHERLHVRWIRVVLYAYWPPGTYYFDAVRVAEARPEDDAAPGGAGRKE